MGKVKGKGEERSSILAIVNDVETASLMGRLQVCDSPVCSVEFEPSGLDIKPRRFCSDQCKMDAWVIKRAKELLAGMSDEEKLEVLK